MSLCKCVHEYGVIAFELVAELVFKNVEGLQANSLSHIYTSDCKLDFAHLRQLLLVLTVIRIQPTTLAEQGSARLAA